MGPGDAIVAIAGMITGIITTGAIVWGIVQYARVKQQGKLEDPALSGDLAALREQVEQLQQQVYDTQERLDFAERLLTRGRDQHEAS
jgi:uncharacterized protein YlxW (UPF0749 family)